MDGLVALGIALAAVVVAGLRLRTGALRRGRLALLCRTAGLELALVDPFPDTLWMPLHVLGRGPSRGTENVVWDARDEATRAFDYWLESPADDDARGRRTFHTCAVTRLPFGARPLTVVPRSGMDPVAALAGEPIELELEAFNRRFRVFTEDRRFAVAFLDQRMMRALMQLPPRVRLDVNEDCLLLSAPPLPPGQVLVLFETARALRRYVPPVVASLYPPRPLKGPHEDRWTQGRWSEEPIGEDA
jgi:hypothetical protein